MKVSEITVEQVLEHLRADDPDEADTVAASSALAAAKAFVRSYTGLRDDQIDEHEAFWDGVMVLCQDMSDNRSYYVDKSNVNRVVETILGMHCVNLVG